VTVPAERAEPARAVMLELFPEGFEEVDAGTGIELAAYTDAGGEERLWHAFGAAAGQDVEGDWADRWRRFHRAIRLGPVWIGPPWEEPPADALAIVIEPARAFGTGAHPSTQLCIELLLELASRGSVLDVGCGSGVLAIVAAKLGFGPVTGLDSDPQAIEATALNAAANDVVVTTRLGDVLLGPLPPADVALANITRETVEALGGRIRARHVITSGYLASERPALTGFRSAERRERDGWAADRFEPESE
jgi:ribosomal protein L11 methyltransferase